MEVTDSRRERCPRLLKEAMGDGWLDMMRSIVPKYCNLVRAPVSRSVGVVGGPEVLKLWYFVEAARPDV